MNLSTLNNTTFKPSNHAYTVYTVEDESNSIYIESDTYGDERAVKYTFNEDFDIEDEEGSFSPSAEFEYAAVQLVKATVK